MTWQEPTTSEPETAPLLARLDATRAGLRRFRASEGLILTALAALSVASVVIAADWAWELSVPVRVLALAGLSVLAVALMVRTVFRPARAVRGLDAAAEVEASFPKLGQRIRTVLDYAEPNGQAAPAKPGLVQALGVDAERRARPLDFLGVIPWGKLRLTGTILAIALLMSVAALIEQPELRTALGRLCLLPLNYTDLDVTPQGTMVSAGSDVTVSARISGRPVTRAVVFHRAASSQEPWKGTPLGEGAAKLSGSLDWNLKNCQDDLEYRVVAGPIESPVYLLHVLHPLEIRNVEVTIEPPEYTRKPKVTQTGGNLKVIEGSRVHLKIKLDQVPKSAKLMLTYRDSTETPKKRVPLDFVDNILSGDLGVIDNAFDYELVAFACNGMGAVPNHYTVRVQRDETPTVRFVKPIEELAVIATTEVPIALELADDFGVARAGIVYQVDDGPKETISLEAFTGQPVTAKLLTTLYLEKHPLTYTNSLTYHAFAEDNRPGKPNRSTTDLRYIDILPYQQEYGLCEGGGSCSGDSVTLGELIARQRANLSKTFTISNAASPDSETTRRLAATEETIAEATAEFQAGLESRFGPQPILGEAVTAMRSAVEALQKRDAGTGLKHEESALATLIKAKQNLRKLLKDSSSSSACRNYDRVQQQNLRRPPKKQETPRQLENDLKALAKEERAVKESLQSKSGQGSSQGQVAARQKAAAKAAKSLQDAMKHDPAMSELAQARMAEASQTVEKGAEELDSGQAEAAEKTVKSASDQLDRLAEQVAAPKGGDLGSKLAAAKNLAQALARQENDLGGRVARDADDLAKRGQNAEEQKDLAEQTKTLADWLKRFTTDAADESRDLGNLLKQAVAANPPEDLAEDLKAIADRVAAGQSMVAGREAVSAAGRLGALATDLDTARRAFTQPKLDQLLAAEKQAAKAQEALASAHDQAGKAEAEKAVSELLAAMEGLKSKPGDGDGKASLSEAARALAEGARNGGGGWGPASRPAGRPGDKPVWVPPGGYTNGVKQVATALQAKIQEIVLKDALAEGDGAVPPRYKGMVEDYYRVLSEDLR